MFFLCVCHSYMASLLCYVQHLFLYYSQGYLEHGRIFLWSNLKNMDNGAGGRSSTCVLHGRGCDCY